MNIEVSVTTRNRSAMLSRLLEQINESAQDGISVNVTVHDDASEDDTPMVAARARVKPYYIRYPTWRGKKMFWKTYSDIIKRMLESRADLFYFLQDDNFLCRDFFVRTIECWGSIADKKRAGMMLRLDSRHETNMSVYGVGRPSSVKFGGRPFMQCQWAECIFMTDGTMFQIVGEGIAPPPDSWWNSDPTRSSGVARAISMGLVRRHKYFYYPLFSFVREDSTESIMHQHRKPMKTWRFIDDEHSLFGDIPKATQATRADAREPASTDGQNLCVPQ